MDRIRAGWQGAGYAQLR